MELTKIWKRSTKTKRSDNILRLACFKRQQMGNMQFLVFSNFLEEMFQSQGP